MILRLMPLRCQDFVSSLCNNLGGKDDAFEEVRSVMKSCIEYVPAELRADFLKLHLFPDQFSLEDAASLWGVQLQAVTAEWVLDVDVGPPIFHLCFNYLYFVESATRPSTSPETKPEMAFLSL